MIDGIRHREGKPMNEKIKDIIFILILGSVSTSLLIGIKNYTMPIIARYEEMNIKKTILDAAKIDWQENSIVETFEDTIQVKESNGVTFYISPDDLFIFTFYGRGLWGMIQGIIALQKDFETIANVKIIAQEETPGLGARITEDAFLKKFERKKFSPHLKLVLRKSTTQINEIDAITGATLTSAALIQMMNESIDHFRLIFPQKN